MKLIEASAPKATTSRQAGKVQHAWKARPGLAPALPNSVVSLLSGLLFAFVVAFAMASLGCASAAPGTIGAVMGKRTDGRLFVRGIPPGQGADRAGLELEDEIVAIDGHLVQEMSEEDIRRAVRGDVGSTLTITVQRGGLRRDVKVQRSPILNEKATKTTQTTP